MRKDSVRIWRKRKKTLGVHREYAQIILAYMENMANQGYCGTQNRLRMCGKYLNVFGECAEKIYAYMEKTQKGSWRILLIRQEI